MHYEFRYSEREDDVYKTSRLKLQAKKSPSWKYGLPLGLAPSYPGPSLAWRSLHIELRGLTAPKKSQAQFNSQQHHKTLEHSIASPYSYSIRMAPKRNAREQTPSAAPTTQTSSTPPVPAIPTKASLKAKDNQSPQEVALGIWQNYLDTTPQRTKLIDVFMGFLIVVGVLQFVYCVIAGNYVCSLSGY